MKFLVIGIVGLFLAGAITAGVVKAATAFNNKRLGAAGSSDLYRVVDNEVGVICYVVPQAHCTGDCAYSPAIACIKL